jgi:hypothetical protein
MARTTIGRFTTPAHQARFLATYDQAMIPNVRAELWPEATHSITTEDPGKVNVRILQFVDGVDG